MWLHIVELKQNDLSNDIDIIPCAESIDGLLEFALPTAQHDVSE